MNETNIEKLNNALMQLIEAYEKLQAKNEGLEQNISELSATIERLETDKDTLQTQRDDLEAQNKDLEFRLNDFSSSSEKQENKMDGMLSKIQSLLVKSDDEKPLVEEKTVEKKDEDLGLLETSMEEISIEESVEEKEELSVLDLKLDDSDDEKPEPKPDSEYDKTKIDLGRMESLLNGLNK